MVHAHTYDWLVFSSPNGVERLSLIHISYSYTGTWSHQWTDADGDGYAEQLQLVWKADGTPISSIDPVSYTHLDVYKRQAEDAFRTPEEFASIALRTLSDGSSVKLGDVAS